MSTTAKSEAAIISPLVDLLCVGSLSIIAVIIFLSLATSSPANVSLGNLLTLATLVNGAHFMASYRLLYHSKVQIMRYKSASIYVPTLLIAYSIFAATRVSTHPNEEYWVYILLIIASLYLALHYTGQTWGMMCSFCFVEGVSFDKTERLIFRACLKIMILWQVVWALTLINQLPNRLISLLPYFSFITDVLLVISIIPALYAFLHMYKRLGKSPPIRVIVPFVTIYFWYALLAKHPGVLLLVQFSHAVQYLIFPVRVEINRENRFREENEAKQIHKALLIYSLALAGSSAIIFLGVPYFLDDGFSAYVKVIIATINIHHFYIDGCIWKISSPVVREDLFAHLPAK